MYTILAKWTILPGKKEKAYAALNQLAQHMKDTEPDTLLCMCLVPDFSQPSLPTPPEGELIFFEVYKNAAAFQAHLKGEVFQNFLKNYSVLFLNHENHPYSSIEILKQLGGFARPGFLVGA